MSTNTGPLEAILLRERIVDREGNLIEEEADLDPEASAAMWTQVEKRETDGVPLHIQVLGRCCVDIVSADDSEFAVRHIGMDHSPDAQYIRVRLTMGGAAVALPRGGDLVAVPVAQDTKIVYEVLLHASEIPPLEPGALALVSLPPGEAVLMLRDDLGLINQAGDGDDPQPASPAASTKQVNAHLVEA